MAATFVGRRVSNTVSQGWCYGFWHSGSLPARQSLTGCADSELLGDEPNPSREVPSRPESPRISDAGNQSGRQSRSDTGYVVEPPALLIGSVPSPDHTLIERIELAAA
jgi:hypothetical protein